MTKKDRRKLHGVEFGAEVMLCGYKPKGRRTMTAMAWLFEPDKDKCEKCLKANE